MSSMIRELWYGNITPQSDGIYKGREFKELSGYIDRNRARLETTLTDEQKEIFDKLTDCVLEYQSVCETIVFEYAFKLGGQFMEEMLRK